MYLSLLPIAFTLFTTVFSHGHHNIRSTAAIQYAPLPAAANGPKIPPEGYYVQPLSKGAYAVLDGLYQSMFLVSTDGVIVVDCPPTIGRNLLYAIGNITSLPVTHFVYSHSHSDHVGGAYLFDDGKVTFIAHEETKYRILQVPDEKRPTPTVTFKNNKTLKAGNQTLELSYKGPNHEPGNIFIYAPEQKVLMLIDVVFPGWAPFSELAVSENIPGWINAHDQILTYEFDTYIGGHLTRTGVRQDVITQKEYLSDLMGHCRDAITNSTTLISEILGDTVALNPGNGWASFQAYLEYTANACAEPMNKKWVGRLGGADVFANQNAYKMIENLRIDYDFLGPFGVA